MAAMQASPSPFGALLRRSKFASFDEQIAQVYTSTGGAARRGNWGVKRTLPMRRRGAYITMQKTDTLEQQTEWNSAESQARWIKKWDELKLDTQLDLRGVWAHRLGDAQSVNSILDSEFAPKSEGLGQPQQQQRSRSSATPNVHAMNETQFQRYLRHIRRQRPAFIEFLAKEAESQNKEVQRPLQVAQEEFKNVLSRARMFLNEQSTVNIHKLDSTLIQNQPHRNGGLNYSHTATLETVFSTKPQPGLFLHAPTPFGRDEQFFRSQARAKANLLVSFAGQTTSTPTAQSGEANPLFNVDEAKYVTSRPIGESFRPMIMQSAYLEQAPNVVGRTRQGLKATRMRTTIIVDPEQKSERPIPHLPGTREYIGLSATASRAFTPGRGQTAGFEYGQAPVPRAVPRPAFDLSANVEAQRMRSSAELLLTLGKITGI